METRSVSLDAQEVHIIFTSISFMIKALEAMPNSTKDYSDDIAQAKKLRLDLATRLEEK